MSRDITDETSQTRHRRRAAPTGSALSVCGVAVEVGSRGCGWEDELAERFAGGGVDDRGCHSQAAQLVTGNRGPVLALVTGATRVAQGQRSVYAATYDNDAAPLAVAGTLDSESVRR